VQNDAVQLDQVLEKKGGLLQRGAHQQMLHVVTHGRGREYRSGLALLSAFFVSGPTATAPDLDGFLWEHNVRHQVGAGFEPNGHAIGLHIAYFAPTYGDMTIRGSYFSQEDTRRYTDHIWFGFSGLSSTSLVVQL
jgi:hypothetical protein